MSILADVELSLWDATFSKTLFLSFGHVLSPGSGER
jgi:hypothetical protein